MSTKASVTDRGAIILGKHVACDAFNESTSVRVVTHAHADHIGGLQRSLKTCEKVLMTKATRDLIDVLKNPLFLTGGYVETLDYGETLQYRDDCITFYKADHILGAAQVLFEDAEGTKIAYTGDFRIDETPTMETDILVIEATYGSPSCKRPFRKDVERLLISLVEEGLKHGTVYVFGYHGKIQEAMQILHEARLKAPFILPERVFHVSKVCERHGMRFGRLRLLRKEERKELLEEKTSCVVFYHMRSKKMVDSDCFRVYVSGWEFDFPCREISDKEYVVALSDHSDFDGLMEYVRRSKPKLVITDNFRVGHAGVLAREIRKRFGISAVSLPKK